MDKLLDINDIKPTTSLVGFDVHGGRQLPNSYYYTENEWSRSVGYGKVPLDRVRNRDVDED